MADIPEQERFLRDIVELRRTLDAIDTLVDRIERAFEEGAALDMLGETVTEMRFFADGARTLAERALRRV